MSTWVVIVAGGSGARFGRAAGKQLAPVLGRPMLAWTVEAFVGRCGVDGVVVVAPANAADAYRAAVDGDVAWAAAGATRVESVAAGLAAVPAEATTIAVHDGARPLATAETLAAAVARLHAADTPSGVVIGHPSYDTMKRVDEGGTIVETPDRSTLWAAQTPQVFRADVLRAAYARPDAEATDDAALVAARGGTVVMLEGPRDNIKVTVPADLAVAEALLAARREEA